MNYLLISYLTGYLLCLKNLAYSLHRKLFISFYRTQTMFTFTSVQKLRCGIQFRHFSIQRTSLRTLRINNIDSLPTKFISLQGNVFLRAHLNCNSTSIYLQINITNIFSNYYIYKDGEKTTQRDH